MKCFKCESKCITEYIHKQVGKQNKIVAVQKVCTNLLCEWKSYPTKIPESIN